MKVYLNQIPPEGLVLRERFQPKTLDLDTEFIHFVGPVSVEAAISKGINCLSVYLTLNGKIKTQCSRCLTDLETVFDKKATLDFALTPDQHFVDLDPEIREEFILDYPMKPLCSPDCLGLCRDCGGNLNVHGCTCKPKTSKPVTK
jgi:uncharacterized protein